MKKLTKKFKDKNKKETHEEYERRFNAETTESIQDIHMDEIEKDRQERISGGHW